MPNTVQKNYRFPVDMAEQLRSLCERKLINEAAFVRASVAEKLEEHGIVVDPKVDRGGKRERKPKTGLFRK